ncbi:hypothetical protein EA187_01270 [Lujinxingia sediminis]|uniref:Uncharacterized protein n=1 Tax=Lujinxingia sediminis TaxID=2480984 RepID=A0ABY0CW45_9DELT|nr:hypothetical protein [Lujinxingia sediminis]RVU48097.1 hypothetical protein EA187_01270 [Lujinxingia sediminis]
MRRSALMVSIALTLSMLSGCTLIRYVDPPPPPGEEFDPKVVDVLVLVDLPRGSANLMGGYANFMEMFEYALGEYNITTRQMAVAPLYRRQGDTPPLIYGRPALPSSSEQSEVTPRNDGSNLSEPLPEDGETSEPRPEPDENPTPGDSQPDDIGGGPGQAFGLAETLLYYIGEEGQRHLDTRTDVPGENLAALGLDLDRATIFDPTGTLNDSRAYFKEAADGFVIIYLTGTSRPCAHGSQACQLDGKSPAAYASTTDDANLASWLALPGPSGLSPSRIFHMPVATAEEVSFEQFADRCLAEPNFPAGALDVMEPSENAYFGPFINDLRSSGGQGYNVDLCQALSSRSDRAALSAAAYLQRILR